MGAVFISLIVHTGLVEDEVQGPVLEVRGHQLDLDRGAEGEVAVLVLTDQLHRILIIVVVVVLHGADGNQALDGVREFHVNAPLDDAGDLPSRTRPRDRT